MATSRIVSDLRTTLAPDRVELSLDDAAFPRDAVYAAAYTFIDRCYVRLDRGGSGGPLSIVLRAKTAGSLDGEALAAELREELEGQAFRQRLAEDGRELTAAINRSAFGAADPENLDDLLDPGDAGSLEDPLGIALQWEEKHAGKAPTGGEQGT